MDTGHIVGGKYRLRKKIGEGGMGSVWSAVHETLDRTVAIKFLQPSGADIDTAAARFVAEAKSAARVKHRFVVDVFDFGITELGEYYMVQELLEGEELADSMLHGAAWEASDVVRFIAQCLTGLEAVHQAGIIHRDLKPENIFVMRDSDGRFPKLVDFGISKSSEPAWSRSSMSPAARGARPRQLTMQGTTLGTPWYMSPEQLRGRRDLDARADLYSIGVILYEWLSGAVPYAEENLAELALRIAAGDAPPLVSLRPELGHELSSVLARAMAPEPDGRFASAAEMREALSALAPSLPQAWSVVQKGAKPAYAASPHRSAQRGAKTEALLAAAERSFGESELEQRAKFKRPLRATLLALGAVTALSLLSLPLFRDARPERASAHGVVQAAPVSARTVSEAAATTVKLIAPAAQAPEAAATQAAAPELRPSEATGEPATAGAHSPRHRSASRSDAAESTHHQSNHASVEARRSTREKSVRQSARAADPNALIHHLDF